MKPVYLASVLVMTLMTAGVVYGVVAVQRANMETRSQAIQAEGVMVFAEPSLFEASVGDTVSVAIKAQSSEAVLGGILGSMTFDTRQLELVKAGPGTFFSDAAVTGTGGKVTVTADERVVGSGTVAVLTFKVLRPGKSRLEFADDFALYGTDGRTNLLEAPPKAVTVDAR